MAFDANAEERHNIHVLLRWVAGFVAFPSWTIALAFLVWDAQEHVLHIAGLVPLGIAAVVLFVMSRRLATRFYPPDIIEAA